MQAPKIRRLNPYAYSEKALIGYYFPILLNLDDHEDIDYEFDYGFYNGYTKLGRSEEFDDACLDIHDHSNGTEYCVYLERDGEVSVEVDEEIAVVFPTLTSVREMVLENYDGEVVDA